jgi:hypothetical protein
MALNSDAGGADMEKESTRSLEFQLGEVPHREQIADSINAWCFGPPRGIYLSGLLL